MNPSTVRAAMDEAERFTKRCKELLKTDISAWDLETGDNTLRKWRYPTDAPKQSGAVKRSSMDLTRALAEMRKP